MFKRRSRIILTWTLATLGVVFLVYKCQDSGWSVKDGMSKFKVIKVEDGAIVRIRRKRPVTESVTEGKGSLSQGECSHFTCLDVSRCEVISRNHISIYIYPVTHFIDSTTGLSLTPHSSNTFTSILHGITMSSFITSDPKDACLFIPSVDASLFTLPPTLESLPPVPDSLPPTLESLSPILESLPFWSVSDKSMKKGLGGENHLLFDVGDPKSDLSSVSSGQPLLRVSNRAMIASPRFDSWTFRPGFDVSIPLYHPVQGSYHANRTVDRKWFLNILSIDSFMPEERRILEGVREGNPESVKITGRCIKTSGRCDETSGRCTKISGRCIETSGRCDGEGECLGSVVRSMEESTFCFLPSNHLLSLVMMTNCIPIQVISDDRILPFEEKIRWTLAVVRIRRDRVGSVMRILGEMTKGAVVSLQDYGRYVYSKYLKSTYTIALTTLEIVNDRMIPFSIKDHDHDIHWLTCPQFQSVKDKGFYGKKNSLKMRTNRKDIFS